MKLLHKAIWPNVFRAAQLLAVALPLVALQLTAHAQSVPDSVQTIQGVTVEGRRHVSESGFKSQLLDSAELSDKQMLNMGELLTLRTPVYVRNYGPGLLSSPSFRGTGANQSQVYWNGLLLNSPMLGQVDLSLLPVFFTDEVEVDFGGSSLVHGPGGLGGSLSLNTNPNYGHGFQLKYGLTIGSFGQFFPHLQIGYAKGKTAVSAKVFYRYAENDFPFENRDVLRRPTQKLENAQLSQYGLLNSVSRKLSGKSELRLDTWLQKSWRQLPHLTIVQMNDEQQEDFFFRGVLSYNYKGEGKRHGLQFGYLRDEFIYINGMAKFRSANHSDSYQLNGTTAWLLTERLDVEGDFRLKHDEATADSYDQMQTQDMATAHVAANHLIADGLRTRLLFRQTLVDDVVSPFIPSLGIEYSPEFMKGFSIRANANRNFRYPTLNDLYWFPGGNPDLKPEEGWSWEGGICQQGRGRHLNYKAEVTYFDSRIDNWIQWYPSTGNFWRPRNVKTVRNHGLESSLTLGFAYGKWKSSFYGAYNFTSARDITGMEEQQSEARHLAYVPQHTAQSVLSIGRAGWKLSYEQTFTGERYTDPANTRLLDEFTLGNAVFAYSWVKTGLAAQLRVNNLFDLYYQSMPYRPMPGRNILFTINYQIK